MLALCYKIQILPHIRLDMLYQLNLSRVYRNLSTVREFRVSYLATDRIITSWSTNETLQRNVGTDWWNEK